MSDKRLIGHVCVDTGTLLIMDPTYPDDCMCDAIDAATNNDDRGGEIMVRPDATGVALRPGFGDGVYPVYAVYDDEVPGHRVISTLIIEFLENEDDDEDFEEE